jgi:RNA polymerase sigma-70 factor (ECF subfamily)
MASGRLYPREKAMKDAHGLAVLLNRARDGDRAAWGTLLERLRPLIRALFRRQGQSDGDASDLTQEVQLRMARGFDQFRGETVPQFLAWVRQIAARVFIDCKVRQPPTPESLPQDPVCPRSLTAGARLDTAEDLARLSAALERLPAPYRTVIEARLFDGLKCVEIAQRLGQSPEWVRVTCLRAVVKLQEQLGTRP